MRRYILTGPPGSGKTSILHVLAEQGYAVVAEAATDVIAAGQARGTAEPWTGHGFAEQIADLQRHRQQQAPGAGISVQIYDRSPICTLALTRYSGIPVGARLAAELDRIRRGRIYARQVFFVRPIGFCEQTAARRISYADSLVFERQHEAAYLELGFELIDIPAGEVTERAGLIGAFIRQYAAPANGCN